MNMLPPPSSSTIATTCIYLQGDTAKYLGMPKGEPSYNLLNLAHEDLRPKLLSLLHRAVEEKKLVEAESIPLPAARRRI